MNSRAKVDALMESIAAVPFTVLLSFEDSEYSERIEPQIRRITLTTAEMHPGKQLLRCKTDGQSCPPSALRDVAFRAGVGCGIIGQERAGHAQNVYFGCIDYYTARCDFSATEGRHLH